MMTTVQQKRFIICPAFLLLMLVIAVLNVCSRFILE